MACGWTDYRVRGKLCTDRVGRGIFARAYSPGTRPGVQGFTSMPVIAKVL